MGNEAYLEKAMDSGNESDDDDEGRSSKYGVKQVFSNKEELLFGDYIRKCSILHYGLTYAQIRKLAFDLAVSLKKTVPPNWIRDETAGLDWIRSFLKRQKDLSLRKPESTSLARASGFNKTAVDEFFDNYRNLMEKYSFPASKIFNLDESGVTKVMKPMKIVAEKGKKQISVAASAERGELVTFVGIINAVGAFLPPVYVYPRLREPDKYLLDAYPGSIALGSRNGWMTSELFPEVVKHIIQYTNASKENKLLLLIDNHDTHISLATIDLCRENGIVLLSFPPHTSHLLQPLDVAVYSTFKTACAKVFHEHLLSNPGQKITISHIAMLTKKAIVASFTPQNILSAIDKPGIFPLDSSKVYTLSDLHKPIEEMSPSAMDNSNPRVDGPNKCTPEHIRPLPSTKI